MLGKVENWSSRVGRGVAGTAFLRNALEYITFHAAHPSNLKYPTHKTEDEKRELRNKRVRLARRKAKETN